MAAKRNQRGTGSWTQVSFKEAGTRKWWINLKESEVSKWSWKFKSTFEWEELITNGNITRDTIRKRSIWIKNRIFNRWEWSLEIWSIRKSLAV